MADDTATLAIVGIVGIVAVAGLILFAMMRSAPSTGAVHVLDPEGNQLYTISDQPTRRLVGSVNFQPAPGP